MYCKVKYCKSPHTHTTKGHQCEKCRMFGHGIVECENIYLKLKLTEFHKEILPTALWCSYGCLSKKYHTKDAHICKICKIVHTDSSTCVINNNNINDISYKNYTNKDFYKILYNYDNCYIDLINYDNKWIIRKKNGLITCINYDQNPGKGEKFINKLLSLGNIEKFLNIKEIDCPICRTKNKTDKIKDVKGLTEKCKVCYQNNIEKIFTKCKHACVCNECLQLIINSK